MSMETHTTRAHSWYYISSLYMIITLASSLIIWTWCSWWWCWCCVWECRSSNWQQSFLRHITWWARECPLTPHMCVRAPVCLQYRTNATLHFIFSHVVQHNQSHCWLWYIYTLIILILAHSFHTKKVRS